MTAVPLTDQQLRNRIAEALRAAAKDCDGDCGLDETQCFEQHPIQVSVIHFDQVAGVYGYIDALSKVAADTVQPELDRLRAELEQAQADVERIRTRENGVRTDRRKALRELDQARTELATARAAAFREAARVLEDSGHDDDAVNLLDNIADGITTHAQPSA